MVTAFESSLLEFYQALDKCHTLCDGPIRFQENLEFPQVTKYKVVRLSLPVYNYYLVCGRCGLYDL